MVFGVESGSNGDSRNADLCLGNLAWAQRFGHKFVSHAEQVGVFVGPKTLNFIVRWHANDRIIDTRDDAGAHSNIGCRDVCCDYGYGPAGADIFVEGWEHNARPCRAAAPEQMPCERITPGQVINRARGSGKRRRGLIAVEFNTSKIEDIEHFNLDILRNTFGATDKIKCLRDGVGGGLMARSNRCVHNGYEGLLCR